MSTQMIDNLVKQTDSLTKDELLQLAERLIEKARHGGAPEGPRPMWREIAGIAPNLLDGEDAQEWVTRSRMTGDEARARQWKDAQ